MPTYYLGASVCGDVICDIWTFGRQLSERRARTISARLNDRMRFPLLNLWILCVQLAVHYDLVDGLLLNGIECGVRGRVHRQNECRREMR